MYNLNVSHCTDPMTYRKVNVYICRINGIIVKQVTKI